MKPEDIKIALQEFESIDNIIPSDNWDFALEQKLFAAKKSKAFKISKISVAVLILVCINFGFALNSLKSNTYETELSRKADFQTIVDELL